MLENISKYLRYVQKKLFSFLEEELGGLSEKQRKLILILEFLDLGSHLRTLGGGPGRPACDRGAIARAFVAKMVYNLTSIVDLIDSLRSDPKLRRICGFERISDIPSASTFSRAYEEFSKSEFPQRVQQALLKKYLDSAKVDYISRDSTDIVVREKVKWNSPQKKKKPPKRRRGRPKKDTERVQQEATRLQKQKRMSTEEMLADLPKDCDRGYKTKAGKPYYWIGYKLNIDCIDNEIIISSLLTSASLHDSQAAIPLAALSDQKVKSRFQVMDSAYHAKDIIKYCLSLGSQPIIEANPRRGSKDKSSPPPEPFYSKCRSTCERVFAFLKESFGVSIIRVRGYQKVAAHLAFSILALTAWQILKLILRC